MKPSFKITLSICLALAAVNATALPNITTQPTGKSVSLGAKLAFQVRATGVVPLSYQWRLSSIDIAGAITNSLSLTNIQTSAAGDYVVVITDASGSATSRVATLQVDTTFTQITAGSIVNDGGASTAASWGDYNNDGWLDLFVSNYNGTNFLYRNKKDGTFESIAAGHMVSNRASHLRGVWGDYNNDGFLDLFVANGGRAESDGSQRNFIYHNNGDGTFGQPSAATLGNIITVEGGFHGAAWEDYDGDGFLDIFVANSTGPNRLYQNMGGTNFVGRANLGAECVDSAWADYDNDGDLDLVVFQVFNPGGKTLQYRNDGHGLLTSVTTGPIAGEGARGVGCSWGDYDNDGFFDLFVSNFNLQGNFLYRNAGDGTFQKTPSGPVNANNDTSGAAWGDYDNDGFLDLFVSNGLGGARRNHSLFHNSGDGTFERISDGSPSNDQGNTAGCKWADYDNDGFLDLFVINNSSFSSTALPQNNSLYRNNGNSNNWLKVRCVGVVSNRGGIGAKVRVKANFAGQDRWQLRQIASTGDSLEAHFGLGVATIIDTLRIEWPSGIVQEFHGVPVKQLLTITEPARLEVSGLNAFRIHSWKGMIFEVETSTDLKQWSLTSTVTNLAGSVEFVGLDMAEHSRRFYRTGLSR